VSRATLPEGKIDEVIWDADVTGFGLRIRPGGKSWILAYRRVGAGRTANTKRMKLGTPETVRTAAEARNLARVALGKIAAGADPLAARRAERLRDRAKLGDLIDRYERDLERRRYVNAKVVANGLRTKMRALLSRDIREITGADLAQIIESYEQAGQPGAGQGFRARCRTFLGWCVAKAKVLDTNPLAGFRKERATRADRIDKGQHGRALTDAELVRVWHAADPATAIGRLFRFYILSGCRRGEGAGLTWAMVDKESKTLNLPAQFVKQGRGHVVPIAPALWDLIAACPLDARSDLVFASPHTGRQFSGWTKLLQRFQRTSGVDFGIHDLRRTLRTGLSRLGVEPDTAELALGHARSELEAIYNRDGALGELRTAFEKWANHVARLDAGVFG
jgi:integrase